MSLPGLTQQQTELASMDAADKDHAVRMMKKYGGGFVGSLADTWVRADVENKERLEFAFAEVFVGYMRFKS